MGEQDPADYDDEKFLYEGESGEDIGDEEIEYKSEEDEEDEDEDDDKYEDEDDDEYEDDYDDEYDKNDEYYD